MIAKGLTPILNVSNFAESVAWFEKLGWTKGFQWGSPPTFGAVCSGKFEIFLCLGARAAVGKAAWRRPGTPVSARTKGSGYRSGWMMWTRSTGTASSRASRSPCRRRMSRGACARCMSAIRTAMSSGSAA